MKGKNKATLQRLIDRTAKAAAEGCYGVNG
jgi:hypothetical protein